MGLVFQSMLSIHIGKYFRASMSEDQLRLLIAKLQHDPEIRNRLASAADLDAAVVVAREAGFDVTSGDWLTYRAGNSLDLSDEELEGVTGGKDSWNCITPSAASCSVVGNAICVDSNTLPGAFPGC